MIYFFILLFLVSSSAICSAPSEDTAYTLLKKLKESNYEGAEPQYGDFETLLNISGDAEVDASIARYSKISPRFNNLVHSERGQSIINKRKSKYLKSFQKELEEILGPLVGIDMATDGVNAQNKSTRDTALILLASRGGLTNVEEKRDAGLARDLISNGAKVNIQNVNGRTALMRAAYSHNDIIGLLLLNSGANPNLQDISGKTALMIFYHPEEIYWGDLLFKLIERSDLYIQDKEGKIALDYAKDMRDKNGALEIEKAMKKNARKYDQYLRKKAIIYQ